MAVDRRTLPPAERAARRERVRQRKTLPSALADAPAPHVYWEGRYRRGGDSGAGSRGEPAQVKADYINRVIAQHRIGSVVDWGCGDGQQLALLNLAGVSYVGVEVSSTALLRCMERCSDHAFVLWRDSRDIRVQAELALAVDTLFHFCADGDYDAYLERLFCSATRLVLIHGTDRDELSNRHVRHRPVTADIASRFPQWSWSTGQPASTGASFCSMPTRMGVQMLPVLSLDAATSLGRGVVKDLEGSFGRHSLAVIVTGSPTAVVVELQASQDGVRFFNIGTVQDGSGTVTVDEHLWRYVAANLDTLSGGTSPTVTAWVASA